MPLKSNCVVCLNRTSLQPMTINANVSRRLVTVCLQENVRNFEWSREMTVLKIN